MEEIKYSTQDFPDDPSDINWKEEALAFYQYMLSIDEKNDIRIKYMFNNFEQFYDNFAIIPKDKQQGVFNNLRRSLYKLKNYDHNITRIVEFIILIGIIINKLQETLERLDTLDFTYKKAALIDDINKDSYLDKLEKIKKLKDKSITKAINETIRLARTEAWKYANEERLAEFIKKGYKFKTTYPVKDNVTGEDSWFYYDVHQVKPLLEPFSYVWDGKDRVFMTPPDRPNDRNILIPYIE